MIQRETTKQAPEEGALSAKNLPTLTTVAFMGEYDSLDTSDKETIKRMVYEYRKIGIYNFFSPGVQAILSEQMAKSELIRNFIMNVTERLRFMIFVDGETRKDCLEMLIENISKGRDALEEWIVLPSAYTHSSYIGKEALETLLQNNTWIIVVYLLLAVDGIMEYTNVTDKETTTR